MFYNYISENVQQNRITIDSSLEIAQGNHDVFILLAISYIKFDLNFSNILIILILFLILSEGKKPQGYLALPCGACAPPGQGRAQAFSLPSKKGRRSHPYG